MQITDEMVEKMCLLLWHELPGFMFGREQHVLMRQLLVSAGQYGGALTPPHASPGTPVRVAVAFDDDGDVRADAIRRNEKYSWMRMAQEGFTRRAAILTATIPPPAVREIAATVLPAGEG